MLELKLGMYNVDVPQFVVGLTFESLVADTLFGSALVIGEAVGTCRGLCGR